MTQEEYFKRYSYDVLEDRIGGGGFGTVYKAYDNVLHHDVAIKVSEVKKVSNGKTFSLKDEIEALSGLPDHPNIANYEKDKLFTFKTPQGVFDYAVMQYYPDGNLSNAIKQGLTTEQKEDIATQLLEGIDFLHKHKVVHRDLKPGNILIVKHGGKVIPLITDFGLSKAAGVVDGSVFSNSFGAGTPRYSSPEQLQGQPLRFNTDLWSYGAIIYEIFTGEQLFSASSGAANTAQADMEIYNKIVNGNVNGLGKMPEKWRKVAERCLVVDATKRVKDAREILQIISKELHGVDEAVPMGKVRYAKSSKCVGSENEDDDGTIPAVQLEDDRTSERPIKDKLGRIIGKILCVISMFIGFFIAEDFNRGIFIGIANMLAILIIMFIVAIIKEICSNKDMPKKILFKRIVFIVGAVLFIVLLYVLGGEDSVLFGKDSDTRAYEACYTVDDYRTYINEYGYNARHYEEAKKYNDQDSLERRCQDSMLGRYMIENVDRFGKIEKGAYGYFKGKDCYNSKNTMRQ